MPTPAVLNNHIANKTSLDAWVELIRRQSMPIFDSTVQQVISLSGDDQAPIADLAGVILRDASLTARVLKLANSIYYNPTGVSISTVTRAVIVLGFNAVLNICLALTLVDELVAGSARERLGQELGRAMHAATQARALAAAQGDRSSEEVFIATLLYRIGELAFWCFSGDVGRRIEQLAMQPGITLEIAEERVLGFRLSQLTRQLVRDWRLPDLLQEAIVHPARRDTRIQTVMLGQLVARCAKEKGWHSKEMDKLIVKAAHLTGLTEDEARSLLFSKAEAACAMASEFGAAFAAIHIPLPTQSASPAADAAHWPEPAAATPGRMTPDRTLQLKVLRELNTLIEQNRCDFNVVMELVLEGIYRGIGMDRVLLALTSPDKRTVRAKYALGDDAATLRERFDFVRTDKTPNALFQVIDSRTARHVIIGESAEPPRTSDTDLAQELGAQAFFVAPVLIQQQCIGIIYADRAPSRCELTGESFDEFKRFVQQGNLGFTQAHARIRQT